MIFFFSPFNVEVYLNPCIGLVRAFRNEFQVKELNRLSLYVGLFMHCTGNTRNKFAITPVDIHSKEGYKGLLSTNS